MGGPDIETLAQDGYWMNSRAKSLDSRNRINTSRRPKYTQQDDRTIPRRMAVPLYSQKPPPPSVEDEYEAIAKEAGSVVSSVPSEEPSNRGDPDQYPILVPVDDETDVHDDTNDQNPERRFVLLTTPSGSPQALPEEMRASQYGKPAERPTELDPDPVSYEANTGRKHTCPPSGEDKTNAKKEAQPEPEHHRGRLEDLPPIVTNEGSERRVHDTRRAKSSTRTQSRGEDYFSPRMSSVSSRYPRDNLRAPEVIEHATNGRERSYYRAEPSSGARIRNRSAHPSDPYGSGFMNERRDKERQLKSSRPPTPELQKRTTSEAPKYSRHGSDDDYDAFRLYVDGPSTYSPPDRDTGSRNSPTNREKRTPPYMDTLYPSEDESRLHADYYRRPAMQMGKTDYLDRSLDSRGIGRRKARGASPLPSPRASQFSLADSYPSLSRPRRPGSPIDSRSPVRSERSLPRVSTGLPFTASRNLHPLKGVSSAALGSVSNPNLSLDSRRSAIPPIPRASSILDSRGRPPTPSNASTSQSMWPPPQFKPPTTSTKSTPQISSYRRYSTELNNSDLVDMHQCPRTREEVGHMDWLMLPRYDNFYICPSCYGANFAGTDFAHEFTPMPFRPRDRPQACNFGTSEYYRIAWHLTKKHGRKDLGLFYDLAEIAARGQQCPGPRQASRIWYSLTDPCTRRPIEEFTVCSACAQTIEALLPSLIGVFLPLDVPAEPSRSVCAMHQDSGRFSLYFDMFESAVDRSLETKSSPNMQALTDRISQLAAIRPCPESNVIPNAYWHTMRNVPDFTVCPECFITVVRPHLDKNEDLSIVGNFHHTPTYLSEGQCMLFTDRMREVFDRAVRKRDIGYLYSKVGERLDKQRECNVRLEALRRQGLETAWAKAEMGRVLQEWRRYE